MLSFAVIFFSFTHTVENAPVGEEGGQNVEISEQLWSIYKLAIMGDFGDEIEVSLMMKFAFILITCVINIIMLNVLISLVCEGFSVALARKDKENSKQKAAKLVEMEATFLKGKEKQMSFGAEEAMKPTFNYTTWPAWMQASSTPFDSADQLLLLTDDRK